LISLPLLVSVVMPSYNQGAFIETAIRSVLEQDYPAIELVVMDGCSSDDTVLRLKALTSIFGSKLRWYSEQDSGPANAINKALRLVKGDLIGWLNSDDLYSAGAIGRAVHHFSEHPNLMMLYGEAEHIDAEGKAIGAYPTKPPSASLQGFHDGCYVCQPTVFLKPEVFEAVGPLDEALQTAFDFELWLRVFNKFPQQIAHIDRVQAYSRLHNACITLGRRREVALESLQVLARHAGRPRPHWLLTCVNEWCATFPFNCGFDNLRSQVRALVEDGAQSLHHDDLVSLNERLANDARLNLTLPGVFVSVYPDGWAPRRLELRLRAVSGFCNSLRLLCVHASPIQATLTLTIGASWGLVYQVYIGQPGPFQLEIPLSAAPPGKDAIIHVESEDIFIPRLVYQDVSDTRELAYKVERLQLE